MTAVRSKRDQLGILQLSREELSERMPDETGVRCGEVCQVRADEISALLIRLAEEKEARQYSLSKLKEKADGTELRTRLLESPGSETDSQVQIALKHIRELKKEIRSSVATQKALMEEVGAKNVALQEARKKDGLSTLRADFCANITTTAKGILKLVSVIIHHHHTLLSLRYLKKNLCFCSFVLCPDFHHLVAFLNDGIDFYGDLIRRLAQLNRNVLDAAYTMNLSRREIELSCAAQRAAQTQNDLKPERTLARQMNLEYNKREKPLPEIPKG